MQIIYYRKANGREPVKEFINKLQKFDKFKIFDCFDDIEVNGKKSNKVDFRQIQGELWEIKITTFGGGYRIFYVMPAQKIIFFLHCYKKQSQKAPKKEIKIAMKRMKEVLDNCKKNKKWSNYDKK